MGLPTTVRIPARGIRQDSCSGKERGLVPRRCGAVGPNTRMPQIRKDLGHSKGCRRRPTLPRSRERSTIGAVGLNDRVRNGNECGPYALVASDMDDNGMVWKIEIVESSKYWIVFALLCSCCLALWIC